MAIESGVVRVERRDNAVLVHLLGEHDLSTSDRLRETLNQHTEAGDDLVVSLAESRFIDSSVIRELYDTDTRLQEKGRRLVLHLNTALPVQRVLDISGLSAALPCFPSVDEAVEQAKAMGGRT